MKINQINRKNS